jgi:hypothetical protein
LPDSDLHLAFYRGREKGDVLDRVIARHDRGPHSHVEIVFGPLAVDPQRPAVCFSSSWRDGGVRFKAIRLEPSLWDTVRIAASERDVAAVRRFCVRHVGGRYDVPGVLAFKLPRCLKHRQQWWFCSEIVVAALQTAGLLGGLDPTATTPNGLYRHLLCKREERCR